MEKPHTSDLEFNKNIIWALDSFRPFYFGNHKHACHFTRHLTVKRKQNRKYNYKILRQHNIEPLTLGNGKCHTNLTEKENLIRNIHQNWLHHKDLLKNKYAFLYLETSCF